MTPQPLWLLAELTYRCPLQCPYCSNPLEFAGGRFRNELGTEDWCRVFREAKALGVLQLGLSGGEPLLRADLEQLVAAAHEVGLYSSLITSAYRLTKDRLAALRRAGLDHVQISVQAADEELSNYIAGTASYRDKLAAYRWTRGGGWCRKSGPGWARSSRSCGCSLTTTSAIPSPAWGGGPAPT